MTVAIEIGDVHVKLMQGQHTAIVKVLAESILSRENMKYQTKSSQSCLDSIFPGPIHEGHGRASYYNDYRATEEQFDALSKIITCEAGGGPFAIYRSVVETSQQPKRARITFQEKGVRSQVKVEDDKIIVATAQLEPMRNPVTGKIYRAIIELPTGFESNKLETSSLKNMFAEDGFLNFKYAGTYGSIQHAKWKGP